MMEEGQPNISWHRNRETVLEAAGWHQAARTLVKKMQLDLLPSQRAEGLKELRNKETFVLNISYCTIDTSYRLNAINTKYYRGHDCAAGQSDCFHIKP